VGIVDKMKSLLADAANAQGCPEHRLPAERSGAVASLQTLVRGARAGSRSTTRAAVFIARHAYELRLAVVSNPEGVLRVLR